MPLITKLEQLMRYTGPPVLILDLPGLASIRRISRENKSGQGYVSVVLVPRSMFPPFTWLETGEFYAVSSLETGYTIADGSLAEGEESPPTFGDDFFTK